MAKDRLNRKVIHFHLFEVCGQSAPVDMPSMPLKTASFEHRFHHPICEVFEIERRAPAAGEYEAMFRFHSIEQIPQRFDDRNYARFVVILAGLGLPLDSDKYMLPSSILMAISASPANTLKCC